MRASGNMIPADVVLDAVAHEHRVITSKPGEYHCVPASTRGNREEDEGFSATRSDPATQTDPFPMDGDSRNLNYW
jgi:hypothetical protein